MPRDRHQSLSLQQKKKKNRDQSTFFLILLVKYRYVVEMKEEVKKNSLSPGLFFSKENIWSMNTSVTQELV